MLPAGLLLFLWLSPPLTGALAAASPGPDVPQPIASLVKPPVLQKVMKEREVAVHARLDDLSKPGWKHYEFYALMLVHAPLKRVSTVMSDYSLYPKMVPYIDQAVYDPHSGMLDIEGGIFKFHLKSRAHFEKQGERALHYRIVSGHFTGLEGRMVFEDAGERGTLVHWVGALDGTQWPPSFIVERGAEIVFGYTGKRMRSYIEDEYPKLGRPESGAH